MAVLLGGEHPHRRGRMIATENAGDCFPESAFPVGPGPVAKKQRFFAGIACQRVPGDSLEVLFEFFVVFGDTAQKLTPKWSLAFSVRRYGRDFRDKVVRRGWP